MIKMSKNVFEERIKKQDLLKKQFVNKELKELNNLLKSKKYDIDTLITKSSLGETYHNLVDDKDKIDSKFQSEYNKTYHDIDVSLYKIDKKIEHKTRLIEYKINNKEKKVLDKIKTEIFS